MSTFELSSVSPTEVAADALIVPFFQGREPGPGVDAVQKALGADLMSTLADHGIQGKVGESFTIPTFGRIRAKTVVLVGLGRKGEVGAGAIRRAAMKAARTFARFPTVASTMHQVGDSPQDSAHAFAEGTALGAYRFDRYKERPIDSDSQEKAKLDKILALSDGRRPAVQAGFSRGQVYAEAANWARDLVNTPAIDATPGFLADEARMMARKTGLTCKIWTKTDLQKGGFGGILGVGAGSINDPRLIELTYQGGGNRTPIAITGKGVTFDSGGLSIKDAAGMEWMKADMGGAAAALATMRAVAELQPKVNVIAAIPSAENLPGGSAIRPGDVLRHRGGKTSEVLNTDAEGRLILADALAYLAEKKPKVIIDSATLTGAAMIALGNDVYAVIGSDRQLIEDLLRAGREEGEEGWELPLWTDYRRHIESSVADVKNIGIRWGGAITAALFLKEFVGDIP
ncbi:MAG TPA: leucyl aminopeptidase, partial [Actinomycetota bacterium]|nr:leucyl aminopeptidase [Actinomycetota bacterium]